MKLPAGARVPWGSSPPGMRALVAERFRVLSSAFVGLCVFSGGGGGLHPQTRRCSLGWLENLTCPHVCLLPVARLLLGETSPPHTHTSPHPMTLRVDGLSLFQRTHTQFVFYGGPLRGVTIRWGALALWRSETPVQMCQPPPKSHQVIWRPWLHGRPQRPESLQTSETCAVCYFGLSLLSAWYVQGHGRPPAEPSASCYLEPGRRPSEQLCGQIRSLQRDWMVEWLKQHSARRTPEGAKLAPCVELWWQHLEITQ